MSQHGHSLSSRRRPSGLIVSFLRALPSALIPKLRPRPNLFIYALLRRHHPALKDSVNWLEIDFTDIARCFLVWEGTRKLDFWSNRVGNLIVQFSFIGTFWKVTFIFLEKLLYILLNDSLQFLVCRVMVMRLVMMEQLHGAHPLFVMNSP